MLRSTGARQMRDLALDLKRAGAPTGLSRKMRRNIAAAVEPIKAKVKENALAIPAESGYHTGLREALARATRISVTPMGRTATVRLIVDGRKMPAGQKSLPVYMEGGTGFRAVRWMHPVYGPHNSPTWVAQASHPFVAPAVVTHLPGLERSAVAALDETLLMLKGLQK